MQEWYLTLTRLYLFLETRDHVLLTFLFILSTFDSTPSTEWILKSIQWMNKMRKKHISRMILFVVQQQ